MRIIAGEYRSRRLLSPPDAETTRPMPARVRESVCGLLRGQIEEGAMVFDGFAGTGSFGLEALSRGASRCVFIERDKRIADLLHENIDALDVGERAELVRGDALGPGALSRCPRPVTIALLDPPYAMVTDEAGWNRVKLQLQRLVDLLTDDGFAIVRTPWPFRHISPHSHSPATGTTDELDDRPVASIEADLSLENAEGPETHVYRSTAVHLYMKAR